MERPAPLIEVRNLKKYFPIKKGIFSRTVGHVKAVDDVSFDIYPKETLGLVGESGCGKTTAGRSLLRLIEPSDGSAMYDGTDIFKLSQADLRRYRRDLQIIFQDPFSSLNPRMTVENLIGEAMQLHGVVKPDDTRDRVKELLERVGLQGSYVSRYPHEFSGGQRQRIGIARALGLNPKFIVADEAVSALDVSVQAQVINLLQDLQDEFDLSFLFIAHDLSVVRHISDRVAVMYLGRVAELAECDELYKHPAHPYTQSLLSAIPEPNPRRVKERIILKGDVPSPINPPAGCRFHTRCPAAFSRCRAEIPELTEVAAGHFVACHLYTEPARAGMSLTAAQFDVHRLVSAGASTVLTNARRFGLDPQARLGEFEMPEGAVSSDRDARARMTGDHATVAEAARADATEPAAEDPTDAGPTETPVDTTDDASPSDDTPTKGPADA